MKKWLFVCLFCFGGVVQAQTEDFRKYAVMVEVSDREAGIGFHYAVRDRWFIPFTVGISNEFQERKWNDAYLSVQPYYLFGKRRIRFPVGLLGGVRWMKDYTSRFTAFYGGCYGGALYRAGRHRIGLRVGIKYGEKRHLLRQEEKWAAIYAYETYRERPLFFAVSYSIGF